MSWRTDLLDPIPGDNPCGADLRYEPIYDEIKEARREDVDAPQGEWVQERKVADWPVVVNLAGDALAKQTKDLQIAAWLTEAMLHREGFSGLKGGLVYMHALLERYWDNLYPELEDGDAEMRAAPLEWIGLKLEDAIKSVPIDPAGHGWFRYKDSRTVPSEAEAKDDSAKRDARKKALDAGKIAPDIWEKSVEEAPKAFYKQLLGDIDGCLAALKTLDKTGGERFGDAAPAFTAIRKAIEEVRQVGHPILKHKLELDPDPPEVEQVTQAGDASGGESVDDAGSQPGAMLSAEPASRGDAVSRIANAAKYLRRTEPSNPAAYLLLRGLRWGEVRACGTSPDPRLLEAPTTAIRIQMKSLLLDQKWPELLEAAESAMAQPCARGWLDLQRYSVTACERLGKDYHLAAKAILGAMREYLGAIPQLVDMMMMDDTPVANEETRTWLRTALDLAAARNGASQDGPAADQEKEFEMDGPKPYDLAMDAVRSGNPEQGIGLLMHALARESSTRGRFRRKTELAELLVSCDREAIALPILQELSTQIDNFKLEEWESGEIVARPLVLLYKCLTKLNGDQSLKQSLYLRICRLDPLQALNCG